MRVMFARNHNISNMNTTIFFLCALVGLTQAGIHISREKMTFEKAFEYCAKHNGVLFVPQSAKDLNDVKSRLHGEYGWIGLHRAIHGSDKIVADNWSKFEAKWNQGEPNNHGGSEDCVHVLSNGKMNDIACDRHYKVVCRIL